MKKFTALKSSLQIATARARSIARQQRAAEWSARLDAASYQCRREGATWVAEGPAGQRFEFHRMPDAGEVECRSHSGMSYIIRQYGAGWDCSCPCNGANDKHLVAWEAVRMAHRLERIETRAALSAEAEALNTLREAGEDAERACAAEWGSANIR